MEPEHVLPDWHRGLIADQVRALDQVWSALPDARLVGGIVRDLIVRDTIADIDLATPDPPDEVARQLAKAGIKTIPTGLSHGTLTALAAGRAIEVTTLRRDEQTDGRHAVVAWTEDWREDARRRDFTINAMSMARDGTVFDYFGGRADLAAGRLRFVGDARARIAEDRLRILRFFRFQARYGRGPADAEALAAIGEAIAGLDTLSPERVWSELRRILTGPAVPATLVLMADVLERVLPGGAAPARLSASLPVDAVLRLAAILNGAPAIVAEALRLSNADAARLAALLSPPVPQPGMDDADLRRLLASEPADLLCGRSWLAHGDGGAALRARLEAIERPVFPLAGRDLLELGLAPGPQIGRMLAQVRNWWLAGGCVAGRDACRVQLAALIPDF